MARHEGPLTIEWHRLLRSPLHLDALSDIGPGDRVAVGVDRDRAISRHRAQQAGLEQIGWAAPMRAQMLAFKGRGGLAKGRAADNVIRASPLTIGILSSKLLAVASSNISSCASSSRHSLLSAMYGRIKALLKTLMQSHGDNTHLIAYHLGWATGDQETE
jgi:hypothetical protein